MKICLLIDGSDNPTTVRVEDDKVKHPYFVWGRAGQPPQQFKLVRSEGEEKELLVFRLHGGNLSDERFEESAALEVDKIRDPEKYRRLEREAEKARRQAAA